MENELSRKVIGDLSGKGHIFVVPEYQRGYRWTEKQVRQLLDDLNEYFDLECDGRSSREGNYYLQPVVLKNYDIDGKRLEVIDGQQRLTTLLLIYSVIMNWRPRVTLPYQIEYTKVKEFSSALLEEKEVSSERMLQALVENCNPDLTMFLRLILLINKEGRLKDIPRELYERFVDYYHIYKASECIENWLTSWGSNKADNMVSRLKDQLDSRVQLIWYKVNEKITAEHVFTRLNDGKIVLTNSELIKALLLNAANFSEQGITELALSMMRYRIASEWDVVEQGLHDDDLWYFLTGEKNDYETRIDLIFSLLADEMSDLSPKDKVGNVLYSYEVFNREFEKAQLAGVLDSNYVMEKWDRITECWLLFKEWFNNNNLYHRIGYLIATASDKRSMLEKITRLRGLDKIEFIAYLDGEIKEKFSDTYFSAITYENTSKRKLRNILLLFNIATLLQNPGTDSRFSFNRYISDSWDIEHVRAVNDKPSTDKKTHRALIENMLIPLRFIKADESRVAQRGTAKKLQEKLNKWLKKNEGKEDSSFIVSYNELLETYQSVMRLVGEDKPRDDLGNLTLLDAKTNRGYKNWTFAAKRKFLLQREQQGQFIPLCTKNVFMKAYSESVNELMRWSDKDAADYEKQFLAVMKCYSVEEGEDNV